MSVLLRSLGLAVALPALSGCAILTAAATGGDVVGATMQSVEARNEAIDAITDDQERAVGQAAAISVIANYGGLVLDEGLLRYVNEIGNAVALQGERKARRRNGQARLASRRVFVGVLDHDSLNAFALPGGYILVTRGLLESLQSESELAWVLGHEMAHCDFEHGLTALKTQMGSGAFMKGNSKLNLADKVVFGKVADWYADFMVKGGFDRDAEREADKLGLEYSTKLGYDADGSTRVLKVLASHAAATSKPDAKKDKSHDTPEQRYQQLSPEISKRTGGALGRNRYDQECLRRLEAYVLAKGPGSQGGGN